MLFGMRGVRLIVAFAASVLAIAAACSTFDEGADPGDGGVADGLSPDGPNGIDGAGGGDADGGDATDAQAAWVHCEDRPVAPYLCDDFDRMGLINARWTNQLVVDGSTGFYDGGLSPPRSFQAVVQASSTVGRAQLNKIITPVPANRLRLAFALRFDKLPHAPSGTAGYSHIAVVQFEDAQCITSGGTKQRNLELSLQSPDTMRVSTKGFEPCVDGGPEPWTTDLLEILSTELADAKFHEYVIDFSHDACSGSAIPRSARVAIDGKEYECKPIEVDVFTVSPSVTVAVGAYNGGGNHLTSEYVYDNVTIETE
jgi:hypothetical protein